LRSRYRFESSGTRILRWLLAAALAGCGRGLASHPGDFSMLSTNRGFPNVEVTLGSDDLGGPVAVTVQLGFLRDRHACLIADRSWRVTVDGVPLVLAFPGGPASPTSISGVEFQISRCRSAHFVSPPGAEFAPRPVSLVEVDLEDRHAEVAVEHLFTRTRLVVHPGTELRPGTPVTLEWQPGNDEWDGYDLSTELHIRRGKETAVSVLSPAKLTCRPPLFHFVMPDLSPGPAKLSLSLVYLTPHPHVARCRWVERCYVHRTLSAAGELDINVLPR
jgi:hypothetical protein